jgi:hypothetical protein
MRRVLIIVGLLFMPGPAEAALWVDITQASIGPTKEWSNKVELADVDGDGLVDILFANGGNYSSAGAPELNRVFKNNGHGKPFDEITQSVFGDSADLARVIKVRDVSGDGVVDIVVGCTYQTQSRLYLGQGDGSFQEVTATHLPEMEASIGDLELGDVDGDGDLDLVLAQWGDGNPMKNNGGRTMLWINDGNGKFTDVTESRMPEVLVEFSWDLEFVDCDNDADLDIVVSCKRCSGGKLFINNGEGQFVDASFSMPQYSNNYDFEAMDLNGDGHLDLVTINDGPGLREHIFLGTQSGVFSDATAQLWPDSANIGKDDNVVAFLDVDSDGDADFVIGSLNGKDRLLINDGSGHLSLDDSVFEGDPTPGTLGLALADLNGDGKLDVVQSQGEVASPDRVFLGTGIAADTAAPSVQLFEPRKTDYSVTIVARIHDYKSPTMPHDWSDVLLNYRMDEEAPAVLSLNWYGEYLWRAHLPDLVGQTLHYRVVAKDAAGNKTTTDWQTLEVDNIPVVEQKPIHTGGDVGDSDVAVERNPEPEPASASDGGCVTTNSAPRSAWSSLILWLFFLGLAAPARARGFFLERP